MIKTLKYSSIALIFALSCNTQNNTSNESNEGSFEVLASKNDILSKEKSEGVVSSKNDPIDTTKYCVTQGNVGLGSYDPLSYFEGAPAQGRSDIFAKYDGVKYYFTNETHKNTFKKNPKKYLPQFGGWCSMTLAMGRATTPDYDNFLIDEDGRLFLFERTLSVNGKELWVKAPGTNEVLAKENYTKIQEEAKN